MKKGVIIVLSLLVVGLGGYIVYDKCLNKTENTKTEEKKDEVTLLDVESPTVKELYNKIDVFSIDYQGDKTFKDEYYGYFYRNDKILASDISDSLKAMIAIKQLSSYEVEHGTYPSSYTTINSSYVKNEVQNIFGKVSFQNANTPKYQCEQGYVYDASNDYYRMEAAGCGKVCGEFNHEISTTIVKAETVNDNVLNIYVKPQFYSLDGECGDDDYAKSSYLEKIYSDFNMTNLVATLNYDSKDDKSYMNKLDTYKFSFEKNGVDYYFKSVEKVK